ncbi:transcription initiation factor TFIID subunit 4-like isoform X2 [Bolinopsis microptera]|uniref:transcription initiation factor TFIID subunit 4-like isoform X2 n=1 Tax=Bolinopsis microptera TaxID=2820187 RepID=UPI00307A8DF7
MSFLDKILESSDVDEKAVSDMQQSLQSDLFTSQPDMTSGNMQSYIPPPPPRSNYDPSIKPEPSSFNIHRTENQMPKPDQQIPTITSFNSIKQEPAPGFHVLPTTVIKSEPPGQMLTMLQPMQQHGPGTPPLVQSANTHQQPIGVPVATNQQPQQAILTSVQQLHSQQTTYTSSINTGAISSASIVPTAVITPQRVNAPMGPQVIAVSSSVMVPMLQVIAVSSSVMVPMTGGPFAVYTAASSQSPQTIMVSATPHSSVPQLVAGVRPSMITQPIRSIQSKPMVVPIQPLVQVKSQPISLQNQPIPIQPAIRPQQQQQQQQPQQPKSEQKTAAILSSMSTRESVQKLKAFLTNLLNISNKQDASTGQTVKDLIGKVMTANIDEETFLNELQVALKSPPQPHLLVFLKQSVPVLRNEMQRSMQSMQGKQPPPQTGGVSSHTPFPGLAPVQTSKLIPLSAPLPANSIGHQFGSAVGGGSHYHPAPTFSVPQRTFADKYKKKYTLSKDDNEINDVASMAGVNLTEEAAKISTQDQVSQEQRSTADVTMVTTESIGNKISRICDRHGVSSCSPDVKQMLSHALEARMKDLMERLVSINHHRLDLRKQDDQVITINDVKSQLKVLQQIQLEETKRRTERERAQLLKEAKSRSKQTNSEAKAKAKQVALEEEQLIRQREANETALAAIGARKRPKSELADNMNTSAPTNPRFRSHRINMRDVVFLCENDTFLKQSKLLFKLHVK